MADQKKIEQHLDKIAEKMNDKEVRKKYFDYLIGLADIFECPIELQLNFEYMEHYPNYKNFLKDESKNDNFTIDDSDFFFDFENDEEYDDELFRIKSKGGMSAQEFWDDLSSEEKNMEIAFDPIYLKKGVNKIKEFTITNYNNIIILVPKPVEDE